MPIKKPVKDSLIEEMENYIRENIKNDLISTTDVFSPLYIKFKEGDEESLNEAIAEAERLGYSQNKEENSLKFEGNGILLLTNDTVKYFIPYGTEEKRKKRGFREHKIKVFSNEKEEKKDTTEIYIKYVKNITKIFNKKINEYFKRKKEAEKISSFVIYLLNN